MSDNEIIRLKPEIDVNLISEQIWVVADQWHSLMNKQTFVNVLMEKLLPVIEEKKK